MDFDDWWSNRGSGEVGLDWLIEAVQAIKADNGGRAIFCLQRAFAHDTALVETIEREWRRK